MGVRRIFVRRGGEAMKSTVFDDKTQSIVSSGVEKCNNIFFKYYSIHSQNVREEEDLTSKINGKKSIHILLLTKKSL